MIAQSDYPFALCPRFNQGCTTENCGKLQMRPPGPYCPLLLLYNYTVQSQLLLYNNGIVN